MLTLVSSDPACSNRCGKCSKVVYDFSSACCQFSTPLTRMNARDMFTTLIAQNIYRVTEATPAAFGRTLMNPQYGKGGLPQVFVPDYSNLQPVGFLPFVNKIPGVNRLLKYWFPTSKPMQKLVIHPLPPLRKTLVGRSVRSRFSGLGVSISISAAC